MRNKWMFLVLALYACGEKKEPTLHTDPPLADTTVSTINPKTETQVEHAPEAAALPEDLSNRIVVYKNNIDHELRLEIMGQNHETLWFYNNGEKEIQVIPQIGENDYYALQDNEGRSIGFMQLNKINEENEFRIAAEIELTINKDHQKTLFRRSSVIQ